MNDTPSVEIVREALRFGLLVGLPTGAVLAFVFIEAKRELANWWRSLDHARFFRCNKDWKDHR
jgi:hypothetical protein